MNTPPIINPASSVYALVDNTTQERTLLTQRRIMSVISYEIENTVISHNARARIFSGFQRMSRFLPQIERYRQLAQNAESVYIFGQMDVRIPPIANVRYIPLAPTDQLAKEWFLVADAPNYFSALATEELTSIDDPDPLRKFKGVWSFDEEIVTILQEWLTNQVRARPLYLNEDVRRDYKKQINLMGLSLARITDRLTRAKST